MVGHSCSTSSGHYSKIFDNSENSIRLEILGISELQSTNSDAILAKITELSPEFGVDLKNVSLLLAMGLMWWREGPIQSLLV